ncbi:MAG: hypothetical protein ISS70_08975 [Phycisphaerae bacterium]|nr:hypothetical protein [Phycisphaerae bacterium]
MQKGWILCPEEMVQGLQAKDAAWGEGKAKVEVEWVARLPRDRAVFVYAPTVATKKGME